MGKATILSGGPDGSYSIRLDTGEATRSARLVVLDALLVALLGKLVAAQAALDAQLVLEAAKKTAVDAAIAAYAAAGRAQPVVDATLKAALAAYVAASTAWLAAQMKSAPLRLTLETLQATQAQAQKDRVYWAGLVLSETRAAWCADLTEDATGTVATLEVPGESALVLIAPAAPAPVAADGLLTAREVQSGPQVYWNAAVLPGWQKWQPTYRRGTITAINTTADTADVLLNEEVSSAQALGINQTPTLAGVPVVYMTCHTAAFEVGDKCVVKFTDQDWAKPRVVGFVDHPKSCGLVLSGVVRGGTLVTLPVPEGAPPGTLGKPALHSYKPTAQAWQYPLKSDPTKSPADWHDEVLLGKQGTQYADVCASMYSGRMAQVVQIVLGLGRAVVYDYRWACCHGVIFAADGLPWLVEISAANGVIAMRLPLSVAASDSPQDAIREAALLFGGLPTGGGFPLPAELSAALAAGTVIRLATVADMLPFFDKNPYTATLGWTFNSLGHEAHNTCYTKTPCAPEDVLATVVPNTDQVNGYHYRLDISIGALASPRAPGQPMAVGSAVLTEVEEGRITRSTSYKDELRLLFYTGDNLVTLPAQQFDTINWYDYAGVAAHNTPLLVFFVNDVLQVMRLTYSALTGAQDVGPYIGGTVGTGVLPQTEFVRGTRTRVAGRLVGNDLIRAEPYIASDLYTMTPVMTVTEAAGIATCYSYARAIQSEEYEELMHSHTCRDGVAKCGNVNIAVKGVNYVHGYASAALSVEGDYMITGYIHANPDGTVDVQLGVSVYTFPQPPADFYQQAAVRVAPLWPDGTQETFTETLVAGESGGNAAGLDSKLICSMFGATPHRAVLYMRENAVSGPMLTGEPVLLDGSKVYPYDFLGYLQAA